MHERPEDTPGVRKVVPFSWLSAASYSVLGRDVLSQASATKTGGMSVAY